VRRLPRPGDRVRGAVDRVRRARLSRVRSADSALARPLDAAGPAAARCRAGAVGAQGFGQAQPTACHLPSLLRNATVNRTPDSFTVLPPRLYEYVDGITT